MRTNWIAAMCAGGLLCLHAGCAVLLVGAGVAAGAGAAAYVGGELKSTEAVAFDKAWDASLRGIADMDFTVTRKSRDAAGGSIVARGAGDRRAEVRTRRVAEAVTELRIRIGTFGDEAVSRQLLDAIRGHLHAPPGRRVG
jgi:hypothetical protein